MEEEGLEVKEKSEKVRRQIEMLNSLKLKLDLI